MKNCIRILQVTESLESGGREAVAMNLYRKIDKQKFQFDFFTLKDEEEFYTKEIKALGGEIYSAKTFSKKQNISRFFKKNYRLYKLMKDNKYSIVHIHACTPLDYIKVLFAKMAKVQNIIMHAHSGYYELDNKFKQIIIKIMKKIFSNMPNYCIACSKEAGEFLFTKRVINSPKYKIIDNSIDLEKYRFNLEEREYYRKLLNIEDNFVIGHVGRFSKEKNHEFIIKCFKKIALKDEKSILLLLGNGELTQEIVNLINKNDLNNRVIILPPSKEVNKIYQAMDIFWFPSLFESFGMVALEAQVSGLKVLISNKVPNKICLSNKCEILPLDEDIWYRKTINNMIKSDKRDFLQTNIFGNYDLSKTVTYFQNLYNGGI